MTTKSAASVPAFNSVTALVAANAEELHVLLRRAVLIRHGETEWTLKIPGLWLFGYWDRHSERRQ
jgi:hypothetical protein